MSGYSDAENANVSATTLISQDYAGFNVDVVEYKNLELRVSSIASSLPQSNLSMLISTVLQVWDIGGQKKIRMLWHHYYSGSRALIYVIDSNDRDRIDEAREELHGILESEELRDIPVLIFANKQDLPRALPPAKIAEHLEIDKLRGHKWHIQGCNAITSDGLYEGLDWLSTTLKREGRR